MNTMTNKAIIIGVGIFITVAITSLILVSINLMKDVYSDVYETDVMISSGFAEFDEFDGTQKTGLDLVNTFNKYKDRTDVKVCQGSNVVSCVVLDETDIQNTYDKEEQYSKKYSCSLNKGTNITYILFVGPI